MRRARLQSRARISARSPQAPLWRKARLNLPWEPWRACARRVLITTAPSGVHMTVVIGALGLRGEVEGKLMRFDKSADINAWLAREGDADALGFGPTTEIVGAGGVAHGGLLPHEAQMVLPYAAAATARALGDADVRTLLAALTSADARAAFEATGMSYAAPSPAA